MKKFVALLKQTHSRLS